MSTKTNILEEVERIENARNTIRGKLHSFGLVETTAQLDDCATALDGIENRGAVSVQVKEGETYNIPAGYHSGGGTVSGVTGGGNYDLQRKTVTPSKNAQSVAPDEGYYGLSEVSVGAIPSAYQDVSSVTATADDVLAGKDYVDAEGKVVNGTMPNNGAVSATIDGLSTTSYTIPKGYHDGTGTVSLDDSLYNALAAI